MFNPCFYHPNTQPMNNNHNNAISLIPPDSGTKNHTEVGNPAEFIPGKYITVAQGTDFRKISRIMTKAGHPMNHATARNILMLSLEKLLRQLAFDLGSTISEDQIQVMLHDSRNHDALSEILYAAYAKREKVGQSP